MYLDGFDQKIKNLERNLDNRLGSNKEVATLNLCHGLVQWT